MMGIGTVLMVSALYGSYALAGGLVAANSVAWAIGTAVLSNLVDRYGQRRVMFRASIVSALTLAVMVLFAVLRLPAWTLFLPAIVSAGTGGSAGALVRARWNYVVTSPQQLQSAYSLESVLDELTFVIGPVVATLLSTQVHPAAGLVAPIVLTLVGARLFYGQRATEPPVVPLPERSHRSTFWNRLVVAVPGVGPVIAVNLLIGCVFGAIDVSVVAGTTEWGVRGAAGGVLAVFSLASGVAGLLYGSRAWAWSLPSRFLAGVLVLFACSSGLIWANSVLILGGVGILVGATIAPTLINGNSLVGRLVPQGRLTEGLAWMGTGIGIGASIGSTVSGAVIDSSGYHSGFVVVVIFAACTAVLALTSSPILRRAVAHREEYLAGK
jgi:MFS family permease